MSPGWQVTTAARLQALHAHTHAQKEGGTHLCGDTLTERKPRRVAAARSRQVAGSCLLVRDSVTLCGHAAAITTCSVRALCLSAFTCVQFSIGAEPQRWISSGKEPSSQRQRPSCNSNVSYFFLRHYSFSYASLNPILISLTYSDPHQFLQAGQNWAKFPKMKRKWHNLTL